MKRQYIEYSYKSASYRISCDNSEVAYTEIQKQRAVLEAYILRYPDFAFSHTPISLIDEPPEIAAKMMKAATQTGLGPMAAVAGAIAERAAKAACREGSREAIIDNGGDIYIISDHDITVGIWPGSETATRQDNGIAFFLPGGNEKHSVAICSSSGTMGHSHSYGHCDLATVVASDGALADAGATLAANLVNTAEDIHPALEKVCRIDGIDGVLIKQDDSVGLIGNLPQIVSYTGSSLRLKVSGAT